jgi:NAD-dependent DNA ligase
MKIVLTGKMSQPRGKMFERFSNYGIIVMAQVSGNVDYLVTGKRPGRNKILEAKSYANVVTLTEKEFTDMLIEKYPEYML